MVLPHPALCEKSYVCDARATHIQLETVRENLYRELWYAWKQVETLSWMQAEDWRIEDWLGVAADVEDALQYIAIAECRLLSSVPDALMPEGQSP